MWFNVNDRLAPILFSVDLEQEARLDEESLIGVIGVQSSVVRVIGQRCTAGCSRDRRCRWR